MTSSEPETDVAAPPAETEDNPAAVTEAERRMDLAVAISDVGPCKKHLKITIPREEIDRQLGDSLDRLRREAPIPGFRPGRAPKQLFLKRFRKELADEVKSTLLTNSLKQIDLDYKLEPLSQPKLDVAAIVLPDEGPLDFDMEVEVRPQFDLPDYRGVSVRRPKVEFQDSDVDKQVARFLARYGQIVPKLEGTAAIGDFLTAKLVFLAADGRVLSERDEIEFRIPQELRFQDGSAPRFGEIMTGAAVGETRDVEATLGTGVSDPDLRSARITLRVEVKDLKQMRLPETSDEFLRTIGFDDLTELRAVVRRALHRRIQNEARQIMRRQIMDALIKATPFDLPTDLISREERNTVLRLVQELRGEGMSENDIRARAAQIRANAHEATTRNFKELLLLSKIAEAEEIQVGEADIELEIESIADRADESPRRIRARMEKEGSLDSLAERILDQKVIDRILGYAAIEDVAITKTSLDEDIETLDESALPPTEETTEEPAAEVVE